MASLVTMPLVTAALAGALAAGPRFAVAASSGTDKAPAQAQDTARDTVRDPGQPPGCPLPIVPGRSIGAVKLGADAAAVSRSGVMIPAEQSGGDSSRVESPPFRIQFRKGKVEWVALPDIRKGPDCLSYQGRKFSNQIPVDQAVELLGCPRSALATGSTTVHCQGRKVSLTWDSVGGLQILVRR